MNSTYLQKGRGQYGAGAPNAGNYQSRPSSIPGFGGRTGRGGSLFAPPRSGGGFISGPMSFTRPYVGQTVSGTHLFTSMRGSAIPVRASQRNSRWLHRMMLTNQLGNSAPTRNLKNGRRIRDQLSQISLDNAPSVESYLEDSPERRSYSEVLASRINAECKRAIEDGWEFFREGEYGKAIRRFEAAEVANRDEPEAVVGIICSALMDSGNQLAYTILSRAMVRGQRIFEVEIDLLDLHPNPEFVTDMVAKAGLMARQNPDKEGLVAMSAFLLWFSGQHGESLRLADQIYEEHRTSPFASMAAQMRGEEVPQQKNVLKRGIDKFSP